MCKRYHLAPCVKSSIGLNTQTALIYECGEMPTALNLPRPKKFNTGVSWHTTVIYQCGINCLSVDTLVTSI